MSEYSNPDRESDAYSLPDIEILHSSEFHESWAGEPFAPGYYWWSCFPGWLPDSDPIGPFDTYELALADAREGLNLD